MSIPESSPNAIRSRLIATLLAVMLGFFAMATTVRAQGELLPPPPSQSTASAETITPAVENVLEIRVVGNQTIPLSQIESQISTRVGRPFDRSVVQRDVRQLANLGWFINVKPLYETTPQGRIVIFEVVERPTIRYVTYLGNEVVNDKKLAKETNLKAGGAVDPYSVEEGRRKLVEYYQGRGHNNVQVTILEGTKTTDKGIVYLINEGNFEKVWDVEFIGNEFVSDGRLKTIIQSKPPKFLVLKGYVKRDEINSDVDRLTAYYRSFGYFQARVSRKIDYYPSKKWIKLTFVIHEGLRYNIRDVRFLGNTKFEPNALAEAGKLKPGDAFERSKVTQDQKWIQELYGSRGYVFADIRPETIFLEEPGDVDLIYHIDEGEQFRIGNIYVNIGGDNPHTRIQTILNPMSIRPGDIADIREINASERRIIARNIMHSDPQSGLRPKLTYRISDESNQYDMVNRPRPRRNPSRSSSPPGAGPSGFGNRPSAGFRGQSPDDLGPAVLPPPGISTPSRQPAQQSVYRGQSPEQTAPPPSWLRRLRQSRTHRVVRKPANPYQNIRGQSPNATAQQAYSSLPAGGVAQSPYGGQIVGATGPAANHAVAQNQNNLQQVQFTENIPPPAGYAGPIPGALPGYQIFPDGRFGAPGLPYPGQTVDIIFNGQETQT
ncbi:MAG: POTRA domain-containing protein, partial [Planctomycetota bacterium]